MSITESALRLLRRLYPRDHQALIGDLLEIFHSGRSRFWLSRQLATLILSGILIQMRPHWPHLIYAVAGTILFGLIGTTIQGSSELVQFWMWSRELPWPLSSAFRFGQTAALGILVLPILAGLMLRRRAILWIELFRAYALSVPLFVAGDLITFLWVASHAGEPGQTMWALNTFGILRIFATLLVSAHLGWRLPRERNPGANASTGTVN